MQADAVRYALRAQSLLLFFVTLAMVQSGAMHWLAHHHGLFHHGGGGGHEIDSELLGEIEAEGL